MAPERRTETRRSGDHPQEEGTPVRYGKFEPMIRIPNKRLLAWPEQSKGRSLGVKL